ncbi:unnamed protein product [Ranitomeya imitator]|uniref:Uncharacterized protein n=1 Tax=Ranitomeya imitator TaxID=111125 RepID=A0ABN9MTN7_9NEOB|nr:unnamed protein product [Ranitomeya imitator]
MTTFNSAYAGEKEEQVRKAIQRVVKYDLLSGSVDSVVLPQQDCVMNILLFNIICNTKEDMTNNLKTLTSWLKIGGYLVFLIALDMSFYRVGQLKFSTLTGNAKFAKESVTRAGFVIEKGQVLPISVENEIADDKNFLFVVA